MHVLSVELGSAQRRLPPGLSGATRVVKL